MMVVMIVISFLAFGFCSEMLALQSYLTDLLNGFWNGPGHTVKGRKPFHDDFHNLSQPFCDSMDLQNDVTSWGMFVVALGLQINVNDVFVGNRSTGIHKSVVFQSRGARSDRIL